MRFHSLDLWLDWQQQLHPKDIELGLERVSNVFDNLQLAPIAPRIITVAGTNGKGSTVAYYETWLKNAGYKVGSYTSPHISRYNERIRIDAEPVSDDIICQAFSAIDIKREDTPLTYFEFGTLAAMYVMATQQVDVAILEVGLGGRLDAVNIVDADLAHITTIGLDHQDWLGETREQIAMEKAGILRHKGLAVYNDLIPTVSILDRLEELQCQSRVYQRDYSYTDMTEGFIQWHAGEFNIRIKPPLAGAHQAHNISGVLAGLDLLGFLKEVNEEKIVDNFKGVDCSGRLQNIQIPLAASVWLDVGHNEDAARVLSTFLKQLKQQSDNTGRMIILLGMLVDKNPHSFVSQFDSDVVEWWLMGLDNERGLSVNDLHNRLTGLIPEAQKFESSAEAYKHALSSLTNQDILLVTGSFFSVEAFLKTSKMISKT